MKKSVALLLTLFLIIGVFTACGTDPDKDETKKADPDYTGVEIVLSDDKITVDSTEITSDKTKNVYTANDIVYYEADKDFTYGEGTETDEHSKTEADAHKVIHITKPGQYILSGTLSKGQIAVDLGEDAEENPDAVVTLVLNNLDITCEVAPAIIFYNVFECGEKDTENATNTVDTSKAGANLIIADGSENNVNGSYVARIYKPDSVVLTEDGTEVEDAKKLHKYDGAFYSKMSMNINGGKVGDGILNINAENEGLDSELHLTVNGGNINITSGNDGINTNEDNISVTTINGGSLNILVNGTTGEGDGIDSNGWLVINGGNVVTQACAFSGDAGIDSDMGIHINGGYVFVTGNMLDRISESKQTFAVFNFAETQKAGTFTLKNSESTAVAENEVKNDFSYLIISTDNLTEGDYTLWQGNTQLQGISTGNMGGPGGKDFQNGQNMTPPQRVEGMTPPEGIENMIHPEGMEDMTPPEGAENITRPEKPDNEENDGEFGQHPDFNFNPGATGELSSIFTIKAGENYFSNVKTV